jgi:hypothetical protein
MGEGMTKNDEKNLEILMWRLVNNGSIASDNDLVQESMHLIEALMARRAVCKAPGVDMALGGRFAMCPEFKREYEILQRILGSLTTPLDLLKRLGIIRIGEVTEFVEKAARFEYFRMAPEVKP